MDIKMSHRNQEGTPRLVFVSMLSVHLDPDSDADQVVVVVVEILLPNHQLLVDIHILTMVQ